MKEVLSLASFAMGVLCFVTLVTAVKPTAINAMANNCSRTACLIKRARPLSITDGIVSFEGTPQRKLSSWRRPEHRLNL